MDNSATNHFSCPSKDEINSPQAAPQESHIHAWSQRVFQTSKIALLYLIAWMFCIACSLTTLAVLYYLAYMNWIPTARTLYPLTLNYSQDTDAATTISTQMQAQISNSVPYDVCLVLDIVDILGRPESVGNFMVESAMVEISGLGTSRTIGNANTDRGKIDSHTIPTTFNSLVSSHLPYQSFLYRLAIFPFKFVPLALGFFEESQKLRIFLFTHTNIPSNKYIISIKLSNTQIPIKEASLEVIAHFKGLRYWAYYWRWTCFWGFLCLGGLGAFVWWSFVICFHFYVSQLRRCRRRFGHNDVSNGQNIHDDDDEEGIYDSLGMNGDFYSIFDDDDNHRQIDHCVPDTMQVRKRTIINEKNLTN